MRSRSVWLKADGFAPAAHEGRSEGPVAGSHVENRASGEDLVQAVGQRRARAAQHLVPETGEPARLGTVPVRVGRAQLLIGRPGRRGSHAAAGAAHPAGKTVVGTVELVPAPGALGGGGRLGTGIGQGLAASSRRTVLIVPAFGADHR